MSSGAALSQPRQGDTRDPLLVVISGPSGVGKDSLLCRMRERAIPAHYTVTATTRPQREMNPVDHEFLRFLTEEEFQQLLANDGLLEHAEVYGYHYGVPKAPVVEALRRGDDVIVRVDTQGAASIKEIAPGAVLIFLAPPSVDELEARLRSRRQDDAATLQRRLAAAQRELAAAPAFDHVVVNERDGLDDAIDQVLDIMAAERSRAGRVPVGL